MIAFLDADDIWLPGKLTLQVRYLEDHPEAGLALTRQRILLEPGLPKPTWLKDELLEKDSVGCLPSTLMVWRSVFMKVGYFDSSLRLSSDAEWFFRASDAGITRGVVQEVLLEKRVHSANLSHQTADSQAALMQIARSSIARKKLREPGP